MTVVSDAQLGKIKKLYYLKKFSVREIAEFFGVGTFAIYYFMRKHNLKRRSFSEQNKVRFARKTPSFLSKGTRSIYLKELKTAGTFLYWAEGYKKGDHIDFTNSDAPMVRVFMKFLREVCGVNESKIRIKLFCYPNQNTRKLEEFWSNKTTVPRSQFHKPYVRKIYNKDNLNVLPSGLIHVIYSDKKLLLLIKSWIVQYSEKWVGTEVAKRDAL